MSGTRHAWGHGAAVRARRPTAPAGPADTIAGPPPENAAASDDHLLQRASAAAETPALGLND